MDAEVFDTLYYIHHNQWTGVIFSDIFIPIRKVLSKKERLILELKVEYYEEGLPEDVANAHICKLLRISPSNLKRSLYDIKYVFRNQIERRVDNKLHPEIYRAKARKKRIANNAAKNTQNS